LADRLLSAEADRRGLTIESLVSQEVAKRTRPVTAGDVSAFLEANPLPAGATESAVAPAIVALLGQRAREAAAEEYIRSLRRESPTPVQVMLEPPRASIPPASHSPTMGPASARVTVVEFSDFECPFCRKAAPMISRLRERFSTEVRFVWRNYPLSIHQHARLAAEAAQCAHDQGRFWAFHDELFRDPTLLPPPHLEATAVRLGLDMEAFMRCLSGHVHGGDVATDVEAGEQVGVSGTPTVFINGVAFVGALSYDVYERAILDELARTLVAEPVAETPGEVNP
jgi:protein-disulfide isomerase